MNVFECDYCLNLSSIGGPQQSPPSQQRPQPQGQPPAQAQQQPVSPGTGDPSTQAKANQGPAAPPRPPGQGAPQRSHGGSPQAQRQQSVTQQQSCDSILTGMQTVAIISLRF